MYARIHGKTTDGIIEDEVTSCVFGPLRMLGALEPPTGKPYHEGEDVPYRARTLGVGQVGTEGASASGRPSGSTNCTSPAVSG